MDSNPGCFVLSKVTWTDWIVAISSRHPACNVWPANSSPNAAPGTKWKTGVRSVRVTILGRLGRVKPTPFGGNSWSSAIGLGTSQPSSTIKRRKSHGKHHSLLQTRLVRQNLPSEHRTQGRRIRRQLRVWPSWRYPQHGDQKLYCG